MSRRIARISRPGGGEIHLDLEPRREVRVELTVADGPPDESALDRLADLLLDILGSPQPPAAR